MIINHISTGIGKIIHMGVPFILLYNISFISFSGDHKSIFKELVSRGVVHSSAESAISHIKPIYHNVKEWSEIKSVQIAVEKLNIIFFTSADKTTRYLLSFLN